MGQEINGQEFILKPELSWKEVHNGTGAQGIGIRSKIGIRSGIRIYPGKGVQKGQELRGQKFIGNETGFCSDKGIHPATGIYSE
jgi:hypothetical protein